MPWCHAAPCAHLPIRFPTPTPATSARPRPAPPRSRPLAARPSSSTLDPPPSHPSRPQHTRMSRAGTRSETAPPCKHTAMPDYPAAWQGPHTPPVAHPHPPGLCRWASSPRQQPSLPPLRLPPAPVPRAPASPPAPAPNPPHTASPPLVHSSRRSAPAARPTSRWLYGTPLCGCWHVAMWYSRAPNEYTSERLLGPVCGTGGLQKFRHALLKLLKPSVHVEPLTGAVVRLLGPRGGHPSRMISCRIADVIHPGSISRAVPGVQGPGHARRTGPGSLGRQACPSH